MSGDKVPDPDVFEFAPTPAQVESRLYEWRDELKRLRLEVEMLRVERDAARRAAVQFACRLVIASARDGTAGLGPLTASEEARGCAEMVPEWSYLYGRPAT